jgi:hypothetical protein
MRKILLIFCASALLINLCANEADALQTPAGKILCDIMKNGKGWDKVRAAEALIKVNLEPPETIELFRSLLISTPENDPYSIGILRVLYKASQNPQERKNYLRKICKAAFQTDSEIKCHAVESLAKLKYKVSTDEEKILYKYIASENKLLSAYSAWLLYYKCPEKSEALLSANLDKKEPVFTVTTAYAIKHIMPKDPNILKKLKEIAASENKSQLEKIFALHTLLTSPNVKSKNLYTKSLRKIFISSSGKALRENIYSLAAANDKASAPKIEKHLKSKENDIRIAAAYCILKFQGN